MSLWLDHFFILTEPGAAAASAFIEMGFEEGAPNSHPGQGTANRRFFFANTAVELLYVRDEAEELYGPAARFRFSERFRDEAASPFGFVFRASATEDESALYPTWRYQAEYLPPASYMVVAESPETLAEPCLVIMPSTMRNGRQQAGMNARSLSSLRLTVPASTFSASLAHVAALDALHIRSGKEHLLEIEFANGASGTCADLRPQLPLLVRY